MALNHTNIKQNTHVLRPNIILEIFIIELEELAHDKIGENIQLINSGRSKLYPPKNKIAVIQLNKTIELYSAKKKNTKGTLECSVKKPATNSDSKTSH